MKKAPSALLPFAFCLLPLALLAQDRSQSRSMVMSAHGIVASESVLASQAGARILENGGNAVDAAIATNAMMGLVAPMNDGIGGDLFAIVYEAKTGKLYGLNASGWAPAGLNADGLLSRGHTAMPQAGMQSVTVDQPGDLGPNARVFLRLEDVGGLQSCQLGVRVARQLACGLVGIEKPGGRIGDEDAFAGLLEEHPEAALAAPQFEQRHDLPAQRAQALGLGVGQAPRASVGDKQRALPVRGARADGHAREKPARRIGAHHRVVSPSA